MCGKLFLHSVTRHLHLSVCSLGLSLNTPNEANTCFHIKTSGVSKHTDDQIRQTPAFHIKPLEFLNTKDNQLHLLQGIQGFPGLLLSIVWNQQFFVFCFTFKESTYARIIYVSIDRGGRIYCLKAYYFRLTYRGIMYSYILGRGSTNNTVALPVPYAALLERAPCVLSFICMHRGI